MDISTITFLANVAAIGALSGSILIMVAKGLPIASDTLTELGRLLLTLTTPMRNLFNKDTKLANALKAKGVDPEIADKLAELGADVIEMLLNAAPEVVITKPPSDATGGRGAPNTVSIPGLK